jgi:hypothetical protein
MKAPLSPHSVPVSIRYNLVGGSYTAPPSRIGDFLQDERYGLVEVTGYTGGRIPWPTVGKRYTRGQRAIILCSPLTEALKLESVTAIRYWWGVSKTTVARWKRTVKAPPRSEGSQRLYQVVCESVGLDLLIQQAKSVNPAYHSAEFLRRLRSVAGNRSRLPEPAKQVCEVS